MLVTLLPFICMGTGLFIGLRHLPEKAFKVVDIITTAALILLMITIGGNIGTNQQVINKIGVVGINCIITCLLAILFSVIFCFIIEKTILPLKKYSQSQLDDGNEDFNIQGEVMIGISPHLFITIRRLTNNDINSVFTVLFGRHFDRRHLCSYCHWLYNGIWYFTFDKLCSW